MLTVLSGKGGLARYYNLAVITKGWNGSVISQTHHYSILTCTVHNTIQKSHKIWLYLHTLDCSIKDASAAILNDVSVTQLARSRDSTEPANYRIWLAWVKRKMCIWCILFMYRCNKGVVSMLSYISICILIFEVVWKLETFVVFSFRVCVQM